MSKNARIVVLVLAGLFCLVFVGVCMFRRTPLGHVLWPPRYAPSVSDVPVFTTPSNFYKSNVRLDLRVRTVSNEEGVILITRGETWGTLPDVPKEWPVFQYDARTRTLSTVNASQWKNAGGPIEKALGGSSPARDVRVGDVDGVYRYRIGSGPLRDFDSHGTRAVGKSFCPDGTILALLTADGLRRPSSGPGMVFGSFGGGFYGQHYIEFFHLPDMKPVGKPVRIPFTTIKGIDTPCWSADGRFLVYANEEGTQMCVIHVGQEGQEP